MQSTTNLNGLPRQDGCVLDNLPRKKGHLWGWRSMKGSMDGAQPEASTLPRGWKQSSSKMHFYVNFISVFQRTTYILEKQDNESFGFEIKTYGLQLSNHSMVEMCTFVCTVHKDSAADCAGLTTGDVILTVNGRSIEGLPHHHVVDVVRQSANILKIETVCGTFMKKIELEKKMSLLKKTLREKWEELQTLVLQEERLTRADSTDTTLTPSIDSLASPDGFCPRGSSFWSTASEDGDQASVFGDTFSPSPVSTPGSNDCFFSQGFPDRQESRRMIKSSGSFCVRGLDRTSSSGGSSSSPTYWEDTGASSPFGTLPRKGRKGSVRRHLLKLIPGLNRSIEQDVVEDLDPDRPCNLDRVFSAGQNQQNKKTTSFS
ncbi:unnamed protein product [Lota lota]